MEPSDDELDSTLNAIQNTASDDVEDMGNTGTFICKGLHEEVTYVDVKEEGCNLAMQLCRSCDEFVTVSVLKGSGGSLSDNVPSDNAGDTEEEETQEADEEVTGTPDEHQHQEEGETQPADDNAVGDIESVRGAFLALAGSRSADESAKILINGIIEEFKNMPHDEITTGSKYLFKRLGDTTPPLYWYNSYSAYVTTGRLHLAPCGLDDNDSVLVSIWQTRCNRPRYDYIVYSRATNQCSLRKNAPASWACDTTIAFDANCVERYMFTISGVCFLI